MRIALISLVSLLGALPAQAHGQGVAQRAPEASNEVSPVTVTPRTEPPRLASTYPAAGQAVAPGVLVIKMAFDQPMSPTGFNFAPGTGGEAPECLPTPRLLDDRKSFVLLCRVRPGKAYALALNAAPAGGFANLADHRASAADLSFTVAAGEPITTLRRAMTAAGLRDVDAPIEEAPRP